ncbi:hypothetical protein IA826_02220 [Listeria seeligeri]|uniref:hypothetical protein n=1 Tax=Listeria seeligeri TaxID=1640 RepID=UPI001625D6DE|nr:hypothetical protein [Listeria seeligeri]MBC2069886.1 hypothetical protein [Listeria seeligeri]MBC2087852.1 hypothetical protein [Listeria seeligeri]MBF2400546.1 hypothetical protein [Listeria seeligeri]MBF2499593.1 hypothetical protein [Listeria seeligeri]MBF2651839.1 hypothetical protein [Listeria seeligeri]
MRLDTWQIEIGVKLNPMEIQAYSLTVITFGKNLDKAIKSAKSKIIVELKRKNITYERVFLLSYKHVSYEEKTDYDCFVELKERGMKSRGIMYQMQITYPEFLFFDNYYQGKTKKLTYQKYLHFKQFMKDEQIRKKYKVPKNEFKRFLELHLN